MHGREGGQSRKRSRHMWPVPSRGSTTTTVAVDWDGSSANSFLKVGVKNRGRSRRGETLAVLPSPLPLLIAGAIVPRRFHCYCHRRNCLGNSSLEAAGFGVLQRNARRYFVASPPSTIAFTDFCFPSFSLSLNDLLSLGQHRVWKCMAVSWSGAKKGDCILDLCCGSGELAFLLSEKVGIDGKKQQLLPM